MPPSQQEYHHHQENFNMTHEYTHKKFNCGYSHKKLGMRLIRRDSQEDLQQEQQQQQQNITPIPKKTSSCSKTLFRPYALDDETPKKRKIASSEKSPQISQTTVTSSQTPQQYITPVAAQLPYHLYQTPQQSQEEYALKLQRQRAALYMKHVMQFYENGNGWPSVHPNAINNPALYHQR